MVLNISIRFLTLFLIILGTDICFAQNLNEKEKVQEISNEPVDSGVIKTPIALSGLSKTIKSLPSDNKSLFVYKIESDKTNIHHLYHNLGIDRNVSPATVFPGNLQHRLNVGSNFFSSIFSYLTDKASIDVPLVIDDKATNHITAYDKFYSLNSCKGMNYIYSLLLNKCYNTSSNSFVKLSLAHPYVTQLGIYSLTSSHLPTNQRQIDYAPFAMQANAYFLGINSSYNGKKFKLPLSNFDELTFDGKKGHFLNELSGEELKYAQKAVNKNSLLFKGPHVESLLTAGVKGTEFENLNLHGIPLSYGPDGQVFLNLRNSLLSDSEYKNYGSFLEAELAVFEDLGYFVNRRLYYGNSIYSSGSSQKYNEYNLNYGYSYYDKKIAAYVNNVPAQIPMGVGLHVYGNYNRITQGGNIYTIGQGAIGIRVDGSSNEINVPQKARVLVNGKQGVGVALSYGSLNDLNVSGIVMATGEKGIGIKASFGSNFLSDLYEYRGSYQVNRTIDFKTGKSAYDHAIAVDVPIENKNVAVNKINISGYVEGKENAILIDASSYVKEINLLKNAVVAGGITSLWSIDTDLSGNLINKIDLSGKMLPTKIQLNRETKHLSNNAVIDNYLSTAINIGVDESDLLKNDAFLYQGNPKAFIQIMGDINGSNLDINVLGGESLLLGALNIKNLYVRNSSFRVDSKKEKHLTVNSLKVQQNGVLDLANGYPNVLTVKEKLSCSKFSKIRVDADIEGRMLDSVKLHQEYRSSLRGLNIEPALKYNDLRRLSADPMAMLKFASNFVAHANNSLAGMGLYVPFPKYIWDSSGSYGREIKCSARGCRTGSFLSNTEINVKKLSATQIIISFLGLIAMCVGVFIYMKISSRANR